MSTENILAPVAALTLPDSIAMASRASRALQFIELFEIASAEDYALAADELRSIKSKSNAIEDQRTSITGPINSALKAINAMFKGPGEMLGQAESLLKRKMLAWDQEQERIRVEIQRKAEEAASAERRRLEAEAMERQKEAAAAAQAVADAEAAGNATAAELARAEEQRKQAEVQAATTAALVVTAPVAIAPVKTAGISTSKKVDFEVVDLHALVKHIAENPELINLLIADSIKLRAYVRGVGTACRLPGVRVFDTAVMSARAA